MSKALELERAEGTDFGWRIKQQNEAYRGDCDIFTATNGISISSRSHPAWDDCERIIYIQGDQPNNDSKIIDFYDFKTEIQGKAAVLEFNNWHIRQQAGITSDAF